MKYRKIVALLLLSGLLSVSAGHAQKNTLRLASTTSTQTSGLLDVLIPAFERHSGYKIVLSATGSGKALQLGRNGLADLLWVHSPPAEKIFIRQGHGLKRHYTMHNDFLLVGPAGDPATIGQATNVSEALQRIANTRSLFISRGDDSGTHNRELKLWDIAGIEPYGDWYFELGQGMRKTLAIADEKQAYLLIDRATWLFNQADTSLTECFQNDPALLNEYSLVAVNPERQAEINHRAAMAFIQFVTSGPGLELIRNYRVKDQSLFKLPAAND